jgi:hypothetical protein
VLRLVTVGRGNSEIAAELFISPRTASVHVSNILAKLGAGTRGEAAATARRRHPGRRAVSHHRPGGRLPGHGARKAMTSTLSH